MLITLGDMHINGLAEIRPLELGSLRLRAHPAIAQSSPLQRWLITAVWSGLLFYWATAQYVNYQIIKE